MRFYLKPLCQQEYTRIFVLSLSPAALLTPSAFHEGLNKTKISDSVFAKTGVLSQPHFFQETIADFCFKSSTGGPIHSLSPQLRE